jgi:Cu/Ag efflux protein CusF
MKMLAVFVTLLLAASLAWAAGNEVQGKVKSWDAATETVTLEDGTMLTVPSAVKERDQLKEGATVKASYEEKDGKKVVSKIDITP